MDLKVILLAIGIVGIAFAGIAIKMFFIKGAEFKKSCGSVDPKTGKPLACGCKSSPEDACHNQQEQEHHQH
jgi:hypothetical protein